VKGTQVNVLNEPVYLDGRSDVFGVTMSRATGCQGTYEYDSL